MNRSERIEILGYMFLIWIIPCSVLYALGMAAGWVLRGFKQA